MSDSPTLGGLASAARSLATETLAWCDGWWDEAQGLPWGPPGHEAVQRWGPMHLIPQAGWYAVGLFLRDEGDDRERALRIIDEVCALQYDEPGTDWHGTYPIMAETPHPPTPAAMWDDYDPNWRQFLGLSWLLLLRWFAADLPSATVATLERAVRLGVEGEPPERCPAYYTNIALKRVAFESIAGELLDEATWVARAEALADEVGRLHDQHGAFEEFNSPTYDGVDLFALAIARQLSGSGAIRDTAARLEASLWRTIGDFYHPGLRNLCGPWTRTYGMDMNAYVAKAGISLALVDPASAPRPSFAPDVPHGHDWFAGSVMALVGTAVPEAVSGQLGTVRPRVIEQRIADARSATAWVGEHVMAGAEVCPWDLGTWDQYVAATMHWASPDGGVGWLSVRMPGPSAATATEGRLDVPSGGGDGATVVVGGVGDAPVPVDGRWALPGLTLSVSTDLEPAGPGPHGGTAWRAPAGADVRLLVT